MFGIIVDFLSELSNALSNSLGELFSSLSNLALKEVLYIEHGVLGSFPGFGNNRLYLFIATVACSLGVLKLIKKGFCIYILWRDGDPDASPQDLVTGTVSSVAIMLSFPYLYDILTDIVLWFSEEVIHLLGLSTGFTFPPIIRMDITAILLTIIYIVMSVILFIQLMSRGVEMLVVRYGIPFACLGLIDSDGGVFKSYILVIFKIIFSSIIQILLLSMSFYLVNDGGIKNMICSIITLCFAFKTPSALNQFILPAMGSNALGKAHAAINIVQSVKRFV